MGALDEDAYPGAPVLEATAELPSLVVLTPLLAAPLFAAALFAAALLAAALLVGPLFVVMPLGAPIFPFPLWPGPLFAALIAQPREPQQRSQDDRPVLS